MKEIILDMMGSSACAATNLYVREAKHQQHHSEMPVHKLQTQHTDEIQTTCSSVLEYVNSDVNFVKDPSRSDTRHSSIQTEGV
jgi:hypothetical protein